MTILDKLRAETGYHPLDDGPVDYLIAYKDALEDLVGSVDELLLAHSGDPEAVAYRQRHGRADVRVTMIEVVEALLEMGFGEPPLRAGPDPYGSAIRAIRVAILEALSGEQAMSEAEEANLVTIEEHVRVLDNA